jgi:hypothetical protein
LDNVDTTAIGMTLQQQDKRLHNITALVDDYMPIQIPT